MRFKGLVMNTAKIKNSLPISLIIALVGFPQISETIYTPALPDVATGLSTSAALVEATLAIYFLGFAFGVLLWGIFSDGYGRRAVMIAGILIYGVGTWACGNANNIETLLTWRFVQAFGASVGSVITQTIIRDTYEGAQRAKLFAIVSGALAFSPAVGPLLGGFISELWGWRANFWVLTIMAILLMIWSYLYLPETRPQNNSSSRNFLHTFKQMFNSRILWGHILLIGATNGILFGFYQEAPFIYIEQLGMPPSLYGSLGLLIAAATVLAARFSYLKSSQFSPEKLIMWGSCSVAAGALAFLLTILLGVFQLHFFDLAANILILFLIFFGIGLIIPNSLSHALKPFQFAAGTAGSIFGGFYYCLIAASTWTMSGLHNGTAWPLPSYILMLGFVLLAGSKMIQKTKHAEEILQ